MSKRNKADIGVVACPVCARPAKLRQMESRRPPTTAAQAAEAGKGGRVGAFYVYCVGPDGKQVCGVVQGSGPEFQRRLQALRVPSVTSAAPEPPARTAPDEPAPVPVPARPPARPAPVAAPVRGFFGFGQS